MLRQLPADSLKVDRSFVRGIEGQKGMVDILNAVTTMARQLGLHVVAEGIEKEEQRALTHSLGCEYGQGYLFARPLDRERTAEFLKTGVSTFLTPEREEHTAPSRVPNGTHVDRTAKRPSTMKALYAAAAVVALLVFVGLPATFSGTAVPEAPEPATIPTNPAPISAEVLQELQKPTVVGSVSADTRPEKPVVPARPPTPEKAASAAAAPAKTLPARAAVAAQPVSLSAAPPVRVEVVHQHRLGSCRGVFIASSAGVAFVPESADSRDGFDFTHGQYLHSLDEDSLTIKSHDRTYRFKAAANAAGGGNRDQLERLISSIGSFQKLTAARQ
jgi:hypothetical protein